MSLALILLSILLASYVSLAGARLLSTMLGSSFWQSGFRAVLASLVLFLAFGGALMWGQGTAVWWSLAFSVHFTVVFGLLGYRLLSQPEVDIKTTAMSYPFVIVSSLVLFLVIIDQQLTLIEGNLLLVLFGFYFYQQMRPLRPRLRLGWQQKNLPTLKTLVTMMLALLASGVGSYYVLDSLGSFVILTDLPLLVATVWLVLLVLSPLLTVKGVGWRKRVLVLAPDQLLVVSGVLLTLVPGVLSWSRGGSAVMVTVADEIGLLLLLTALVLFGLFSANKATLQWWGLGLLVCGVLVLSNAIPTL